MCHELLGADLDLGRHVAWAERTFSNHRTELRDVRDRARRPARMAVGAATAVALSESSIRSRSTCYVTYVSALNGAKEDGAARRSSIALLRRLPDRHSPCPRRDNEDGTISEHDTRVGRVVTIACTVGRRLEGTPIVHV